MIVSESPTLEKYKHTMAECLRLYYPDMSSRDLDTLIDYSIKKRYKQHNATLTNTYMNREADFTLLQIADYIARREPILTAYGTMFKHHGDEPNPLANVVDSFLSLRKIHKKEMFKYARGSELFERYNLLQQLDKIDCNGLMAPLARKGYQVFV